MPTIRETALEAHAARVACLPASEDGTKTPDVGRWREYTERQPTPDELGEWFPKGGTRTGIGLVMGWVSGFNPPPEAGDDLPPRSGLECIDFDDREWLHAYHDLAGDAGLGELWDRVREGYTETTPNGAHVLYYCPEIEGNQKLASEPGEGKAVRTRIETRGEGGWIVAAPSHGSVHPSGDPYVLIAGGLATIATVTPEERAQLLGLARSMDRMPTPVASAPRAVRPSDGDAPGDLYNDDASITTTQVLVEAGWTLVSSRNGADYLRRPGKSVGISASVGHIAPGIARIFTTSTVLEAKSYDKFGIFAEWYHGGDFAAAGRELYASYPQYRGAEPERLTGTRKADTGTNERGRVRAPARVTPAVARVAPAADGQLGDAEPVGEHEEAENGDVATYANRQPESEGSDNAPTAALLGTESGGVALPRRTDYHYETPFPEDHLVSLYVRWAASTTDAPHEFHETLALVVLAAMAGPHVKSVFGPWPKGIGTNLYVLLGGPSTESRKSTSVRLAKNLIADSRPGCLLPSDWSPEAFLEEVAARNGSTSVWAPDEFQAALEGMTGRSYMAGARGMMLTLYDGDGYTKARTKKNGGAGKAKIEDSVIIVSPHVSIIGACTPAIYDKLTSADVEDGLIPRFAIVLPSEAPPYREIAAVDTSINMARVDLVRELTRLAEWSQSGATNIEVEWHPAALAALNVVSPALGQRAGTAGARLPAMLVKVAMLSALGRGRPGRLKLIITAEDVRAADVMCERWLGAARRFAAEIGGQTVESRRASQNVERLVNALREAGGKAKRRDIRRSVRSMTLREFDDAATDAAGMGLILVDVTQTGGRPAVDWVLG